MSTSNKPLARLLFAQGGKCFFCEKHLAAEEASVEHLMASTNGGSNADENCVACCKSLNALLGRMSLKEKLRVVLNQKGSFKCPGSVSPPSSAPLVNPRPVTAKLPDTAKIEAAIIDLRKRGAARPRTLKTLTSTIYALFKKQLPEVEVFTLIAHLRETGVVIVEGAKVSYKIPNSDA